MKFEIQKYKQLKSTQITAKKLAEKKNFLCIVANKQTSGYGQRGAKWVSSEKNLMFSLIMPNKLFDNFYHINILVCVSFYAILSKYKIPLQFKWPNDLYLNNKKLGGILNEIESDKVITGIGFNVGSFPFLKGKYKAVSLQQIGFTISKEKLLKKFLKIFGKNLDIYLQKGIGEFFEEFNDNLIYKNQTSEMHFNKENFIGKFMGINHDGSANFLIDNIVVKFMSGFLVKAAKGTANIIKKVAEDAKD